MKKKYDLLEVRNNLGIESLKIKQIALVNSKSLEAIVYIEILDIDKDIQNDILKLKKILLKISNDIVVSFKIEIDNIFEISEKLVRFLIFLINMDSSFLNVLFKEYSVLINEENININVKSYIGISNQAKEKFIQRLENIIKHLTNKKYDINFNVSLDENIEIVKDDIKDVKVIFPTIEKEKNKKETFSPAKKSYFKTKLEISNFKEVDNLMLGQEIALRGEIFYISLTETRFGNVRAIIYITNDNRSIICSKYLKAEEIDFKLGDMVEVQGKYDKLGEDYALNLKKIQVVEKIEKEIEDLSEEKRIELAAHTNMSEMLSTIESKELIKRAKKYSHKAIAVTDYGVVHAFPFLAKEVKMDEDFKIIYGIDAYMVDDLSLVIHNLKEDNLIEDQSFVVFDIETTGLNAKEDKIIEIGAVKIKNSKVIEEFSCFINPEMKIPLKIIELTGINDTMVENAKTIDKVLPEFLEFIKDSILVAHNAKFDIGFITKKANFLGLKLKLAFIDTLEWAKILVEDTKKFGLDALTKKFKIKLDNHHRAIDDSRATAELFKIFLSNIKAKGLETLYQINENLKINPKNADTENVTILVKNLKGLKRLYELVSISHLKYFADKRPRMLKSDLAVDRENFLISSSPVYNGRYYKGELVNLYVRGANEEEILEKMSFYDYVQIYPNSAYNSSIFLEEMPNFAYIENMNKDFVKMAQIQNKLVVATGNVYYLDDKDRESKFALDLASEKSFKTYQIDDKNYFRTTNEMLEEFSYLENAKEIVIDNTHKISDMIEKIKPIPDGEFRPVMEGSEEEVRNMTYNKAYELYGNPLPKVVEDRIKRELDSIIGNGFAVLYLIAQKLVKKSVDNGYLVGSRGSVGSSLVAYLMGITEVNSLYPHYRCDNCKYFEIHDFEGSGVDLEEKKCPKCQKDLIRDGHSIPFEVFMGFKGDKTPDIDLNFSGEYQSEVHKYTKELFGDDFVFRAGTISTFAEKNAFIYVRKYYESIKRKEFEKDIFNRYGLALKKLDAATREEQENRFKLELDEYIKKNKAQILKVSKKCEGARKTTGQHPGGMIVVPNYKSIYDFSPVQYPANDEKAGSIITHFDYHVMDQQLVKLDILGHDDPTTLRMLQDLTNVNIYNIPLTDPKVLSLFSNLSALGVTQEQIGNKLGTNGIPEFGTDFVKKMLEDTLPKSFAELVRISGLSHGTDVWLNNAQEYIRSGVATLSEVITVRDDIMNHLIDMGMDNSMAFNIMEFVRKGQPSKNKEKWEEYKKIMKESNIKDWYIESCEKIKYMFPKGHAVAYVMMAVRIAYFKVYYPLEFYVAYLNRKFEDFSYKDMYRNVEELKNNLKNKLSLPELKVNDKRQISLYEILIEMSYRNIEFLPIDIYKSDSMKFKIENGKIRIPLVAMDQLGEVVAKTIEIEREKKRFTSIEDMIKRGKINKTVIDMLKKLGCIDANLPEKDQLELFCF